MKIKILLAGILFPLLVTAQEIKPGEFALVNITYTKDGAIINEDFLSPVVVNQALFNPNFIDKSPRDPNRKLENLPNYGLALFHHWLFGEVVLRNAQMHYALCVGEIKAEQRRLKQRPYITEVGSPLKPVVDAVLGYHVPFLAVQNGSNPHMPPKKEDAIAHAFAAIDTVNVTVANLKACEVYRDSLIVRKR